MADKNVVKGRRLKSGHWTFQAGFVDPALVGAQLGAVGDGNCPSGGNFVAPEPGLNAQSNTTECAGIVEVILPEAPGLALCDKTLSMGLCDSSSKSEAPPAAQVVQQKATKVMNPPITWGWDAKFAARVANISNGTIDEYLEVESKDNQKNSLSAKAADLNTSTTGRNWEVFTWEESEPPLLECATGSPIKNSPDRAWTQVEPRSNRSAHNSPSDFLWDSRSGWPSLRNPNSGREDRTAQSQTHDRARAFKMDGGLNAEAKPPLPTLVQPGPLTPAAKGVSLRNQSEPIAIGQTNLSKNTSKRSLVRNTPPGPKSKGSPVVLTTLLPETRKYAIKPIDEITNRQSGQVGFVVWVNNLSDSTTYEDLEALVKPFGPILKLHLAEERDTGCWGFAYVHYQFEADADRAIAELNGKALDNAVLNVVWSNPTRIPN